MRSMAVAQSGKNFALTFMDPDTDPDYHKNLMSLTVVHGPPTFPPNFVKIGEVVSLILLTN